MPPGIVYLVGAGPGDPGLLTLRGAECIRRADVVVYDRLAHPDHLRHARPDAELIYVGKQSAQHTLRQEEINALLVDRALVGKTVCRLKGGDPYIFGRGGEEAEECLAAGVPFEVVPGVTSAIAAPSYAGIPVTHRDAASSFAVITGHERDDAGEAGGRPAGSAEQRRNWANIAHAADTLVFLMGAENIGEIASRLLEHGRSPETPIALVRWGTWPAQETLVSTLGSVAEDVRARGFKAPAVTVVGEVVRLRETLRWFDKRPLFGKRVVVTRAREQASGLSERLRELGAEPVEFPVIRIVAMADHAELDAAIDGLRSTSYSWVVFTSANGVRFFRERLESRGLDARVFSGTRIAAIGPATADALREIGIRADFVPSRFVAESVVEEWPDAEMNGKRVLLPRAREARELLPDRLREMGAVVDVVTAYETVRDSSAADQVRKQLVDGEIDAVTFTSSSTVSNFVESIGREAAQESLRNVVVACIGPITAGTARGLGIEPTIVADEFTIPGIVDSLVAVFGPKAGQESLS
jgi:uroporphyrinogen III methyltransferase/synthase